MLDFRKIIQNSVVYLNPFDDFNPFEGKIEIRWDPLTNLTSRIVHFPAKKIAQFNFDEAVRNSLSLKCPFCPGNIEKMTSKFDKDRFGYERFEIDGVVVIPNLLTFDKYCLVAILSREHFVDMDMLIREEYLSKGISALIKVLRIIKESDKDVRYYSINCNYMPMSGSSILHPHIQAIAGEYPTNYHGLLLRKSEVFFDTHESMFWDVLMDEEKELNERFIFDDGRTFWCAPFAPRGNIDLNCITRKNSIFDLDDVDMASLGKGLEKMLVYLKNEHVSGFNFSFFSGLCGRDFFRSNMRVVARRFLPPVNASDTNYFDKIHLESACLFFPEDTAYQAQSVWAEKNNNSVKSGFEG